MKEYIKIPANVRTKLTFSVNQPSDIFIRVSLIDGNQPTILLQETYSIENGKSLTFRDFKIPVTVEVFVKTLTIGTKAVYDIKFLGKRKIGTIPNVYRGGGGVGGGSVQPETGNFLLEAQDSGSFVLQAANGSRITLNTPQ